MTGCPLVAEFCIAELGAVLGVSTTSAKKLIGHALELRHRLPRLWAQVQSGDVPAWRARAVAEVTTHTTPSLTVEATAWVDAQVAAVAGRIGPAQLDRLVAETIKRYDLAATDPAADPEDGYLSVDPRHATLHDEDVHFAGTMRFEAELDIADALDLDRALVHGAATLKALGSTASLDVRRSEALGDLARTQTALELAGADADPDHLPAAREVVLHAHFDATVVGEQTVFGPTGRLEEGQRLVLIDQVRDWCSDSRTHVTIKPVIDLTANLSTTGVRDPRPDPRPDHPARPHVRVSPLRPTSTRLRRRPRHPLRPPGRGRGPTTTRPHRNLEPRRPLPATPPPQDPHRLALPHDIERRLRVDQPPRPPVPPRPHRHHRDPASTRTRTTLTPPRTPPQRLRRGHRRVRALDDHGAGRVRRSAPRGMGRRLPLGVPKTRQSPAGVACPLCGGLVPVMSSGCRDCHLPMADIRRHSEVGTSPSESWARAAGVRIVGVLLYGAVIAWCWWQLPASLPFVVPAAVAGLVIHGVKGRPLLAMLAFAVLVVSLPVLLAPALGTGAFSDLAEWINDPQW